MPVRALIYSIAGFGKSAMASALPKPLFIDIEGSTERYNVSRVEAKTEAEVRHVLQELIKDRQGFLTVVIDTADWLEAAICDAMCKAQKVTSIAECSGGYGKGFVEMGNRFGEILTLCDTLISKGMHVVFLAHSLVKKVSPPDQVESYDRYEIALDAKNVAAPLREWAEMILFGKFDTALVKTKEKKFKADLGEQSRTLYTTNSAAWDAKNRFNLPPEIVIQAVEFGADGTIPASILPPELAAVFAGTTARVKATVPVVQPIAGPAAAAVVSEAELEHRQMQERKSQRQASPAVDRPAPSEKAAPMIAVPAPITAEQRAKLEQYSKIAMCAKVISAALNHYVVIDVVELTEAQADKVIERCQEEMNKPAAPVPTDGPGFLWPASCREWLTEHAAEANLYLHKRGHITASQSWINLPVDRAEKIAEHFEAFKKSALGGAK